MAVGDIQDEQQTEPDGAGPSFKAPFGLRKPTGGRLTEIAAVNYRSVPISAVKCSLARKWRASDRVVR